MSTYSNRGASGGPCGGLEETKSEPNTVRPTRSDSSQQASSKPGAVHPQGEPVDAILNAEDVSNANSRCNRGVHQ
jgi:hypothetical protein